MKNFAALSFLAATTEAFQAPASVASRQPAIRMDLKELAKEQSPFLGYYDPLNLGSADFWNQGNEATVGFLRQSEIKHGRVAMMAFVGYCVTANGITWPWPMTTAGDAFPTGMSPPDAWDAIPMIAKLQIVLFVGFLEQISEDSELLAAEGQKHYMRGGKPGYMPSFDAVPHPCPYNLYDPFGLSKGMTDEQKAKRLNMEVNNGRLAMLGIMSFLAESKVEGSVPMLKGIIPAYSGDYMVPFAVSAPNGAWPF